MQCLLNLLTQWYCYIESKTISQPVDMIVQLNL
jgi:hypothetical protein